MTSWELDEQHQAGLHAFKEMMSPKNKQMKLICIEGNIGAGKSTLTQKLAALTGSFAMFEPVAENPYLEKFYADPKRYALEMQFWLMSARFAMHEQAIRHIWKTGQSVIMDRSIYGDYVFAKKNWLDGNIEDIGFRSYMQHRSVMERFLLVPHVVIALDVHPVTCQERIMARGRNCEKIVPREYLEGLHYLHQELVSEMRMKGSEIVPLKWDNYGLTQEVAVLCGLQLLPPSVVE